MLLNAASVAESDMRRRRDELVVVLTKMSTATLCDERKIAIRAGALIDRGRLLFNITNYLVYYCKGSLQRTRHCNFHIAIHYKQSQQSPTSTMRQLADSQTHNSTTRPACVLKQSSHEDRVWPRTVFE